MHIYACVRACVSVWMRACGRRDYRVRVCPRETHAAGGRPHTRTRVSMWLHVVDHTLTQYQDFAERIEFVEITFSRELRSRNANCYPTGIREPAMVNSNF